ncbi:hypothetical protein RSOL_145690, partial [Rhizoctonia solani AG-3 Rhs1AP]
MCSLRDAKQHFASTAEAFANPDWETSPSSMTRKLRDIVEKHQNYSPPYHIEQIEHAIVHVQKFELCLHQRCRVKEPDAPIHHDPFWYYNGYDEALDSLVWCMQSLKQHDSTYCKEYTDMLCSHEIFFEFFMTLNLWKRYCQAIEDAPAMEAAAARARVLQQRSSDERGVATWEYRCSK